MNGEDGADCVVARCLDCECLVFAAVNEPRVMDHETFKEIGQLAARGYRIKHMTVVEVRKSKFGCKCK